MKFSKAVGLAVLAGAVATLAGCAYRSPIPLAENFELTVQPKVRSAGHWELVSHDVADRDCRPGLGSVRRKPLGQRLYPGADHASRTAEAPGGIEAV